MKSIDTLKQEIFNYVKENTFKDTSNLANDTRLFVEGIFDSMGFVLLLEFLEDAYEIRARDSDLIEDNFESIDAITGFMISKKPSLVQ